MPKSKTITPRGTGTKSGKKRKSAVKAESDDEETPVKKAKIELDEDE